MVSMSTPAAERTSLASVTICSLRSGLRLWGIVKLPTVAPDAASAASPISRRWRLYTSLAMRASVAEARAALLPNSAMRSRAVSQEMAGSPSPRRLQKARRNSGPSSP